MLSIMSILRLTSSSISEQNSQDYAKTAFLSVSKSRENFESLQKEYKNKIIIQNVDKPRYFFWLLYSKILSEYQKNLWILLFLRVFDLPIMCEHVIIYNTLFSCEPYTRTRKRCSFVVLFLIVLMNATLIKKILGICENGFSQRYTMIICR